MEKISQDFYINVQNNRIKELRKELKMSQDELANAANVSRTTLWQLERGDVDKISAEKWDAIAKVLAISPDLLLAEGKNA